MAKLPVPHGIPPDILANVYREARNSYPAECCGWLSGPRDGADVTTLRQCVNAQASGAHPTQADRGAETAYVLTGRDLLALNQSLDGDMPAQVIPPQWPGILLAHGPGSGLKSMGRRSSLPGSATGSGY